MSGAGARVSVHALGECALVVDLDKAKGGVKLHGPRGVLREWFMMQGRDFDESVIRYTVHADPPRLALQVAVGTSDFDHDFTDPNEVSLAGNSSFIETVDVPSGEIQARVRHFVDGAFSWAPDGNTLWVQIGGALTGFDANGEVVARIDAPSVGGAFDTLKFDEAGRTALCLAGRGERATGMFDLVERRLLWSVRAAHATAAVATSANLERAYVAEGVDGGGALYAWDLAKARGRAGHGDVVAQRDDVARLTRRLPASAIEQVWTADAGDEGDIVAARDGRGGLSVFLVSSGAMNVETYAKPPASFAADVDVDLRCMLALDVVDGVARLHDLRSSARVELAGATRACLGGSHGARVPVALVGGAAHIIDEAAPGNAREVPGPTDLVELAPHARGVLAVDAGGRAHVIDIDVGVGVDVDVRVDP